jgi:hypothetical protein
VSSRLGSFYSSRFLMIAELESLQAANRRPITMPGRHSSTLACCQAPFAARLATSPLKSTRSGKAGTSYPARTTRSARMRVTGTLRAYWLSSSSIQRQSPGYTRPEVGIARKWSDDSVRSMSWPQRRRSSGQRLSLR